MVLNMHALQRNQINSPEEFYWLVGKWENSLQQTDGVSAAMVVQLLAGRHHAGSVLLSVEVSSLS